MAKLVKVGETVKIVRNTLNHGFRIGEAVEVASLRWDGTAEKATNGKHSYFINENDYEKLPQDTYKVGDKAVVVANTVCHGFDIGEEVTIIELEAEGKPRRAQGANGKKWYISERNLKKVDNTLEAKYGVKVGDKIVITARLHGHRFNIGDVVTVNRLRDHNIYAVGATGDGWYLEPTEFKKAEIAVNRPYGHRFNLGDVVYLKHVGSFSKLGTIGSLKLAEGTSDDGIRLATEDERRKYLGLPPVKKGSDLIEINITVSRSALREGVEILGKATGAYELYDKLDDINDKANR